MIVLVCLGQTPSVETFHTVFLMNCVESGQQRQQIRVPCSVGLFHRPLSLQCAEMHVVCHSLSKYLSWMPDCDPLATSKCALGGNDYDTDGDGTKICGHLEWNVGNRRSLDVDLLACLVFRLNYNHERHVQACIYSNPCKCSYDQVGHAQLALDVSFRVDICSLPYNRSDCYFVHNPSVVKLSLLVVYSRSNRAVDSQDDSGSLLQGSGETLDDSGN